MLRAQRPLKKNCEKEHICPRSEQKRNPDTMRRRCPQPQGPRPCRGLRRAEARRPSPTSSVAPGDSARKVKPKQAARLPRAPPSPLALPPLSGPLRGTGGARRDGGRVASSAGKAQPPRSGGLGLLINSAFARAPLRRRPWDRPGLRPGMRQSRR